MTEQEIIQYLKDNMEKGIAFHFMPEEVKEWCRKYSKKLCWYDVNCWSNGGSEKRLYDDKIYALSEDFNMEEEPKGGWAEFDINKNGDFAVCGFRNDKNITIVYNWTQWDKPIRDNASKNFINGCCAFGGWQYANSNRWFMTPRLKFTIPNSLTRTQISYKDNDTLVDCYTTPSACECEPAIPVKIRFWKECI